jgi:DNA-binding NarL/FixJ family response regulator
LDRGVFLSNRYARAHKHTPIDAPHSHRAVGESPPYPAQFAHLFARTRAEAPPIFTVSTRPRTFRGSSVARDVLKQAREFAHACGAAGLERRALQELHIAGARPQRVARSGREALTASELRAPELAAQGLTNRQIAETLFVTLKTVELHLGHSYGKLGIRSRSQLPEALATT